VERWRRGTTYIHSGCRTSGARTMLRNRCPSPPPDFLWNLVALANFMRLSLLKGARATSSSAAWQEIRVPGWAEVWLPALRAWVRSEVYFRVPTHPQTFPIKALASYGFVVGRSSTSLTNDVGA
jgi:hypothetical protein